MSDRKQAIQTIRMLISVMKEGDVVHLGNDNLAMMQNVMDELMKLQDGVKPYGQTVYFEKSEVFRMKRLYEMIADRLYANGLLQIEKQELPDKRTVCKWKIKAVKWE